MIQHGQHGQPHRPVARPRDARVRQRCARAQHHQVEGALVLLGQHQLAYGRHQADGAQQVRIVQGLAEVARHLRGDQSDGTDLGQQLTVRVDRGDGRLLNTPFQARDRQKTVNIINCNCE